MIDDNLKKENDPDNQLTIEKIISNSIEFIKSNLNKGINDNIINILKENLLHFFSIYSQEYILEVYNKIILKLKYRVITCKLLQILKILYT